MFFEYRKRFQGFLKVIVLLSIFDKKIVSNVELIFCFGLSKNKEYDDCIFLKVYREYFLCFFCKLKLIN